MSSKDNVQLIQSVATSASSKSGADPASRKQKQKAIASKIDSQKRQLIDLSESSIVKDDAEQIPSHSMYLAAQSGIMEETAQPQDESKQTEEKDKQKDQEICESAERRAPTMVQPLLSVRIGPPPSGMRSWPGWWSQQHINFRPGPPPPGMRSWPGCWSQRHINFRP